MKPTPFHRFAAASLAIGAVLALAFPAPAAQGRPSSVRADPDDRTIVHVLNRVGFGPAPGDVVRVRRIGLAAYLEQQLHPDRVPDTSLTARLARFETLSMSTRDLAERYYIPALMQQRQRQRQQGGAEAAPPARTDAQRSGRRVMAELAEQKLLRAISSERQLQEVMVDFWFNHFNVFAGKGPTRIYMTAYERDVIRPHAFGRFRDLLGATAQSPAMLFYLDNWQSAAPEGVRTSAAPEPIGRGGRSPGPVRARQPRARTSEPAPAGGASRTPAAPAGASRRPRGLNENYARELMELHTLGVDGGYSQKDVQEVARAFTGWTIAAPRAGGPFRFDPRMHDDERKEVLGHRLAPGGGMGDGEEVLDILARHPSTARFIATKLVRRFVADEPPPGLVSRAAARFTETDGDIREVVRTIITSPEFFAPAAYRAKVKTPLEFVASAARAAGMSPTTAAPLMQALRELGMPPYMCQPPTGYPDVAEAWVNTGALLVRLNFAVALTTGGRRTPSPPAALPSADDILRDALADDVSEATRATIARATAAPQAVALALGSPEFQKR